MNQAEMDEEFLQFESKVHQVMKILDDMASINKGDTEQGAGEAKVEKDITEHLNEDNFIVTVRENRTFVNKRAGRVDLQDLKRRSSVRLEAASQEMDKFTFMQQIEKDADARAKQRREREKISENFRMLGNEAYRKLQFDHAVVQYTMGIEHIRDSPILYNNRALCYLKLKNYKRAIADCDYVLNKLEEKNLRSWVYRAFGFSRLGDLENMEQSLKMAKKNNPKKCEYIDEFMQKARADF